MVDYKQYKLGLLKQEEDLRDYKITKLIPQGVSLDVPDTFLPTYNGVYDQGQTSMCCACANAWIRHIQESLKEQSGVDELFSPAYIYGNRLDGEIFEGMYLRSACKQVVKFGVPLWSDFSGYYTVGEAVKRYQRDKATLDEKANKFRVTSFYTCNTDDEIKLAIYKTGAVLVGINVTNSFYNPDKNGVINYPRLKKEANLGGHAVVIEGYKTVNKVLYYRIKNSWGSNWGVENGYCYMKASDFNKVKMDEVYAFIDNVDEYKFKGNKEE